MAYGLCFLIYVFEALIVAGNGQATMGIDFGGESIKVSIVTTRKPQETVLDRDSNRKTLSMVGLKDCYLVFSDSAKSLYRRSPELVVPNVEALLGRHFDDPSVVEYRRKYPKLNLTKNETDGSIEINFEKCNLTLTPVEIMSVWLSEIRGYTKAFSSYDIADYSIAFDPIIDQAKIEAIVAASHVSGMNILEIMDTSRTISTQYIMSRKKFLQETPQIVMFIDVGSHSTIVTIARVGLQATGKPNKSIPSYNITGIGYRKVGGSDLDALISEHLVSEFKKKHKISDDIKGNPKAHAKFCDAAISAKRVLSSSKEARINIDEAFNYITFSSELKREQFKQMSENVLELITDAVDSALISANISADVVSEVILMGGGSLAQIVQERITTKFGKDLSRVLNTDESNAAGASLLAAKIHKLFQVSEFHSPAYLYYPVEVEYSVSVNNSDGVEVVKSRTDLLYPHMSKVSAKKILTISNVTDDFTIHVRYGQFPSHMKKEYLGYTDLFKIDISGIKNITSDNAQHIPKHVNVYFKYDNARLLTVTKVEYAFRKNLTTGILGKMGKAVMDMFGMGSNKTETPAESEETQTASNDTEIETNTTQPKTKVDNTSENFTVPIPFIVTKLYFIPPSAKDLKGSAEKLAAMYKRERLRNEHIKSKSNLEGAIFDSENKIVDRKLRPYGTDEEWKNIKNVTNEVKTWYDEEGHSANTLSFNSKLVELQNAYRPVDDRLKEEDMLEKSMKSLYDAVNHTQTYAVSFIISNQQSGNNKVGSQLIEMIYNKTTQIKEDVKSNYTIQKMYQPTDPPILTSFQVRMKIRELEQISNSIYKMMYDTGRQAPPEQTPPSDSKTSDEGEPQAEHAEFDPSSGGQEASVPEDMPSEAPQPPPADEKPLPETKEETAKIDL